MPQQIKIAVITGTSSGVGLELSILLAQNGYKVYATMRNPSKSDKLVNKAKQLEILDKICIEQMDVTDNASITNCINKILQDVGHIDLLVNNAGAGFIRTVEQSSIDEIDWVTKTNYLSVVNCVKAVVPHMRKRRCGHIINITSVGGLVGQPFNELYCGAKFAVEGFTEAMATYMNKYFNIKFTLVEPGGISSEFAKNVFSHVEQSGGVLEDEYKPILDTYIGKAANRSSSEGIYQTPLEVASIILSEAIQAEKPPLRIRTSSWAEKFCELKTSQDPDGLKLIKNVEQQFLG